MTSKLVNQLAKVYDPNPAAGGGKAGRAAAETDDHSAHSVRLIQVRIESLSDKMDKLIHIQEKVLHRLDSMSQDIGDIEHDVETLKVDKEEVHLQAPTQFQLQQARGSSQMREICQEMTSIISVVNERSEQQARKLEGMEKLVLGIQEVIGFIGETVKGSRLMELLFKDPASRKERAKEARGRQTAKKQVSAERGEPPAGKRAEKLKEHKGKETKERPRLSLKGLKSQKKKKPPDSPDTVSLRKQALLLAEVQKLNEENAARSGHAQTAKPQDLETGGWEDTPAGQGGVDLLSFILEGPSASAPEQEQEMEQLKQEEEEVVTEYETEEEETMQEEGAEPQEREKKEPKEEERSPDVTSAVSEGVCVKPEAVEPPPASSCDTPSDVQAPVLERHEESQSAPLKAEPEQSGEVTASSKRRVAEEDLQQEEHKRSCTVEEKEKEAEEERQAEGEEKQGEEERKGAEAQAQDAGEKKEEEEEEDDREGLEMDLEELRKAWLKKRAELEGVETKREEEYKIDCSPPPSAPFKHRIVSAKPNQINNFYTINRQEVLGGGRFGQVHRCIENSSGLTLAAKIIKARAPKEKEVVKNEIQVMNQLDHANLIQLYAAYESRNDIILVLEYVDGGELFDRIIDENYTLTELDGILFIQQICEGLQHMHKMSIVHLDLKPENIMCVSRLTHHIKIIDFGLARKYKPKEKLRVNFGTPEFLAPEVVNYEFVSYRTDMWSLGVITYMLLSSLSPFLGDDNNETMNNILACQWNFEEEEFTDISEEAKDFISKLLIPNKSWRLNADEALRHAWLSDPDLHYHLHVKKNMCRSRRSSCVPVPDS
ncbi:myosin light chain kinase 2, skeletal/cardiac muscle-like isoform X2 [Megalops cyprinoides]|uniref:myosin light chain kinase 2, skeletal/cardiac muscle-like isoform X2 n=1 Tax=Megalops cyprinoides TaxID=118141 RepID=UPI001864C9B4|nr:myosin light chain kinase 2, skeletal/cardiac muscle-like isoform X2 [Megalops cyprinoides]